MSGTAIPIQSMFSIVDACNGAMMQSALLGNTVAEKAEETTQGLKPLYDDIYNKVSDVVKMQTVMNALQIISVATMGIGALGSAVALLPSALLETLPTVVSAGINAGVEAAESVANAAVKVVEAGTSGVTAGVQVETAHSNAAMTLDHAAVSTRSSQSSLLMDTLKDSSDVKRSIAQATASVINGNGQEMLARKR